MEVWRSGWPLGGMPWGRLAFGVVDTPVAEALPYAGAVGVSFLLALSGALLAWLVSGPVSGEGSRRVAALALVGLVALLAVPALAPWTAEADREVTVAAVQGDVPGNGDDILYDYRQVTQNRVNATVDLARQVEEGEVAQPDLVLSPGNSTAVDPFDDSETNAGIWAAEARRSGCQSSWARSSTARAPSRSSTRASSGTRRPAPETGTPSGIQYLLASTHPAPLRLHQVQLLRPPARGGPRHAQRHPPRAGSTSAG